MISKAVLVGVNKYAIAGADLQGCVNDVTNVRDILLTYFKFDVENIRVLADDRATKEAILDRLKWLVRDTSIGDRLLFHFSGHGSQIRDRDGDELKDHLDEILCPYDMNWDGTYILDDELDNIFSRLPEGVHLEVILDSCHSGTGTRQIMPSSEIFTPIAVARYLKPPIDILCREEDSLPIREIMTPSSNPGIYHTLFAGCKSNQTSADTYINRSYNGAFTYYFCKHLRESQGLLTRIDLLKRVRFSLRHDGYSQIPQLECRKEKMKLKVLE